MIERLTPNTRMLLVKCRVLAMRGEIEGSLKELRGVLNSNEIKLEPMAQLSILMLQAEILYLDGHEKESFDLFEKEILPVLNSIPQDTQNIKMIVEDNYYDVAIDLFKPGSLAKYYQLSDLKKLSEIQFLETESLIAAHEKADDGKLYDAFPVFWRQLPKSYYLGNWRAFRLASNRLAKECLKLNLLDKAAFYSILARNQEIAEEIGNRLLELKDKNLIKNTVERIVNYSHLFRHSNIVCRIIGCITDAIPNDQVESVFQWLYQRCKFVPQDLTKTQNFINAYRALKALSIRLNLDQTKKVIQLITNHVMWKSKSHFRENLVKVLHNCVERLSLKELSVLSKELLSLATDLKSDLDYADVINLLGYIAERVGGNVKDEIVKTLYPGDTREVNVFLEIAAEKFGKSIYIKEDLRKAVENMANDIRMQVQHLHTKDEPKHVLESYFSFCSTVGDKKTVVNAVGANHLKVLIKQSKFLEPDMVKVLTDSILEMISEPDNMIGNKIALIECLIELSTVFSEGVGTRVFEVLGPIILGKTVGGIFEKKSEEAADPLNPFKFKDASPAELRGYSLYALACMERGKSGLFGKKLNPLIENALLDVHPEIRKHAFAASRENPELSDQALIGLLFGTRDPDPNVAIMAFDSIISKTNQKFSNYHWELLAYSLVMEAKSSNVKLRRMVAIAIKSFRENLPSSIIPKIKEIERDLINDVCYSVRNALGIAEI